MKEKKTDAIPPPTSGICISDVQSDTNLSVRENIEVGAYLSDRPLELDELPRKHLGCMNIANKLPNQLSGGQQQRTAIGRAIIKIRTFFCVVMSRRVALDYKTSKEILCLIEQINQKYGNTVIMVTHNDAIKNMARPCRKAQGRTDPEKLCQ